MKTILACLLILTFVVPASARERTPLEQARKIAPGSKVVVTLKNKVTLNGRLGQVTQDGFTLEPLIRESPHAEFLFRDVRKISPAKDIWPIKDILLTPVYLVMALGDLLWFGELPTI
jgi:hypothetical protein